MARSGNVIQFPFSQRPEGSPPVLILDVAESELQDFYLRSGACAKLRAHYARRIKYLAQHGRESVFYGEWFELLENDLYCMRFDRVGQLGNLRIIYCFYGNHIILLVPFLEKGSKCYAPAKELAYARLKKLKEESVLWYM